MQALHYPDKGPNVLAGVHPSRVLMDLIPNLKITTTDGG
jgi:hypothetical protein